MRFQPVEFSKQTIEEFLKCLHLCSIQIRRTITIFIFIKTKENN